jgi:urease accessory protein UreF
MSELVTCAIEGNVEKLKTLLYTTPENINEALVKSAKCGHTEIVRLLLDIADYAEKDYALCWAAENGQTETVALLLD